MHKQKQTASQYRQAIRSLHGQCCAVSVLNQKGRIVLPRHADMYWPLLKAMSVAGIQLPRGVPA